MINEVYQGLIGGIVGRYWWGVGHWDAEGSPGGVGFNHKVVMDRQVSHGDVVGFFHTHPSMPNSPSHIDYNTMGGWASSFGKPLVCCIRGANGLAAHWFVDDEMPPVTGWIKQFGNIFVGRVPGVIRRYPFRTQVEKNRHGK